jgi:hypothetical protein
MTLQRPCSSRASAQQEQHLGAGHHKALLQTQQRQQQQQNKQQNRDQAPH